MRLNTSENIFQKWVQRKRIIILYVSDMFIETLYLIERPVFISATLLLLLLSEVCVVQLGPLGVQIKCSLLSKHCFPIYLSGKFKFCVDDVTV